MSDWYKMNPVDWNEGTNTLSLEQEAAYLRICNAIYIAGGAIANNPFVVAGLLRCNDRKAKRLVSELVEAEKITIEDGSISNRRALDEVSARSRLSAERESAGRRGGIESGNARRKSLKTNEPDEAIASSKSEQSREEKKRGEVKEEPNGSSKKRGSRLPDDWHPDMAVAIREGLEHSDALREADKFRDHWVGQPGQRGVKADWQATWRNWVRKAVDYRRSRMPDERRREERKRQDEDAWAGVL
ncbi:DUF1376 domain-containing protein [Pararhizobium mangrovi]|uniref:DUF1376 domain-containing protein n=1 Tax=Pararhizobium mangrovi TaxID=2590452 RepID=A0A506TZ56_9HYPH|nr:DUF1376 domain-containing protein [Pararhizobium mangrovi]TPW26014.1 DUF1376 domain-containing protein [Pararhizobium mangrovi]